MLIKEYRIPLPLTVEEYRNCGIIVNKILVFKFLMIFKQLAYLFDFALQPNKPFLYSKINLIN